MPNLEPILITPWADGHKEANAVAVATIQGIVITGTKLVFFMTTHASPVHRDGFACQDVLLPAVAVIPFPGTGS